MSTQHCCICLNDETEQVAVCKSSVLHKCCYSCYMQIFCTNSCPLCRSSLKSIDIGTLPYVFDPSISKSDIWDVVGPFYNKWKRLNFFRAKNRYLFEYFSLYELSIFTQCKLPQEYTLYRGTTIKFYDYYEDDHISSWSKSPIIAKRFGIYVYKIVVPYDKVLIDLDLISNDTEQEVVLLSGKYKIITPSHVSLQSEKDVCKDKIKQIFTRENRDTIISSRKKFSEYTWTIKDLHSLCLKNKIYVQYNKWNKPDYVDAIIEWVSV